jgi:hypothetical protein
MRTEPIRLLASRQEAAEAFGVSVRMIDVLAEQGELRPVWIGARKLFSWADLRRLAEGSVPQLPGVVAGPARTGARQGHAVAAAGE